MNTPTTLREAHKQINDIKKRFDKAVEVIKFYASKENWTSDRLEDEQLEIQDDFENDRDYVGEFIVGGRRAREFLAGLDSNK